MDFSYVPPPPEIDDDFRLEFSSQHPLSSQRTFSSSFRRQSEFAPTHSSQKSVQAVVRGSQQSQVSVDMEDELWNEGSARGFVQRVPETPSLGQSHSRVPSSSQCRLDFSFDTGSGRDTIALRSVSEVPERYHGVFKQFSHFNFVQSKVFDDVMYTDSSLVTSAPTGSGKTVIFELAIVRLLMQSAGDMAAGKIIYVAPIKALCSERFEDWQAKFGPLGLRCCELTGDTQLDDYFELQNAQIVMTTPEKWDSMTRKWRDYKSLVQLVRLFLIDEVHQLNDETRGPTMEAIVSRMKTIQASSLWENSGESRVRKKLRFIAISATIPNITDIACWLGHEDAPALDFNIDESHRPVRLRRVVLGYPDAATEFKFDLFLNYRLSGVIQLYSDQKPTLVFCATRKGTQQAAGVLVKEARFVMNVSHKQRLQQVANSLRDSKLRDLVLFGVGYHHAGMDVADRKAVETMFTAGDLPVLFATSTLAMGVNLPAHLVVIKSTMHYIAGMFQECSESQILQMIGRAGRPQFDTTATAVIMTRNSTKAKYEALLSGKQLIESSLHHNLIEHLNAEVVLHTITDVSIALEWLRSTFFYIRVKQNPEHYGMPAESKEMEEELQQLCLRNLQMLESCSLVKMNDGFILEPSELGCLMARYCVAFESMKRFLSFKGKETLADLVNELSQCKEFQDVRLRVNEKRVLNTLNKDKIKPTIRFQMPGKVKSTDMKVNCLIQATLGCLPVQEFALNQDTQKIFRAASRLAKCLMEVQILGENFQSLYGAVLLHKCIQSRLWENSKFVSKQLDKIGLTLSTTLVNAGLTTFEKLQKANPRELELIMNRHPPFGNQIRDAVALVPQYQLRLNQVPGTQGERCELEVTVSLVNYAVLAEKGTTWQGTHTCMLLIGDADNTVLCKQKLSDSQLLNGGGKYTRKVALCRARGGDDLKVHYISLSHVGVDVLEVFTPKYTTAPLSSSRKPLKPVENLPTTSVSRSTVTPKNERSGMYFKPCNHRCLNKAVCGHDCCKNGIPLRPPKSTAKPGLSQRQISTPQAQPLASTSEGSRLAGRPRVGSTENVTPNKASSRPSSRIGRYANELHARATDLPATPALKRITPAFKNSAHSKNPKAKGTLQERFSYTPRPGMKFTNSGNGKSELPSVLDTQVVEKPSSDDDEFWSLFNDNNETDVCKTDASFPDEYDTLEPDLFFDDRSLDCTDVNEFASGSSICPQPQANPPGRKQQNYSRDGNRSQLLRPNQKSYNESRNSMKYGLVLDSHPVIRKTLPSAATGRKRIIDEILEVECFSGTNPVSKRLNVESSGRNHDGDAKYSASGVNLTQKMYPPSSQKYPPAQSDFFSSKPEGTMHRDKMMNIGQMNDSRCPLLAVAGDSNCTKMDRPHSVPLTQATPEHLETWRDPPCLDPKAEHENNTSHDLPKFLVPAAPPISYSFFTAGTVDTEEDENDGDVFGSVFAGIF